MSSAAQLLKNPKAVGTWTMVPDRSTVTFANKTLWGLQTVTGTFTAVRGHGEITDTGEVTGEVDIESGSVDTGSRLRDRHLRSSDFFKVDRFPRIAVVVIDATPAEDETVVASASITVTGTTKPLPLRLSLEPVADDEVRVSTTATIDHDALGLRWNKLWMLSRKTKLSADTVFRRDTTSA